MPTPVADFDGLYDALSGTYARAAASLGETAVDLDLAGRRVALRCAGIGLSAALVPALAHLTVPPCGEPADLTIAAWDSATSGLAPPRVDLARTPIGPKGIIPALTRLGGHAAFAYGAGVVQVYDAARGRAVYWTDDAGCLPDWERALPFRQILAWFLAPAPLLPVHAACVAQNGRAVLLPGASGAGKSTTALRLGLEGFDLLGDDYVLIEAGAPHRVWSLYGAAKVDARALALLSELAPHAARPSLSNEKALVAWPNPAGGRLGRCAAAAAILLPRVSPAGGPCHLAPASPGDVVLALAPTTIAHLDGAPEKVLSTARALAQAVPAHRLELGPDTAGLSALVRGVLEA